MPGEADRLPEAFAFLHKVWSEAGLPEEQRFPFELALEEVFMNVAMHGGRDDRPALAVIEERQVGGLGVFLVREMMDGVSYARAKA